MVEGPNPAADVLVGERRAEPGGRPVEAGDVTVAIGPEGGWTEHELSMAAGEVALGRTCCASRRPRSWPPALMVARAGRAMTPPDREPFGVYVHIPFCAARCDYCAFATWTDRPT